MKNNYTVYMHISPSNKRYIGITKQKVNERWRNGQGYKRNKHFINAINLYGWDNFEHIVIARGLSEEEAKWLEMELIRELNTTNNDYGYNITKGGDSSCEHSDETKRKISESKKGKYIGENNPNYGNHWTNEQKKRQSDLFKDGRFNGENNPNYGNYWTDEQKEQQRKRMSEIQPNRWKGEDNPKYGKGYLIEGENNPSSIKVICLETKEIFPTIKEAMKSINGTVRIYDAIRNNKKYKGYTFMYYEDYLIKMEERDEI